MCTIYMRAEKHYTQNCFLSTETKKSGGTLTPLHEQLQNGVRADSPFLTFLKLKVIDSPHEYHPIAHNLHKSDDEVYL